MRRTLDCCDDKTCVLDALRERQSRTLKIVLAINAIMFVVESVAGWLAGSTALFSDSLDNLGDAFTYALSLFAVNRAPAWKARVALVKGLLILAAAAGVIAAAAYKAFVPSIPLFEAMGAVSALALAANSICFVLLWKHRREDVNMSSVWECSRNDIASNLAVLIAAGAVWLFGSGWPDLAVGVALACLLLRSSVRVLRTAMQGLKDAPAPIAHPVRMVKTR